MPGDRDTGDEMTYPNICCLVCEEANETRLMKQYAHDTQYFYYKCELGHIRLIERKEAEGEEKE